jgi:hypothetical protein
MWHRKRVKEIWNGFVHRDHLKFFKQLCEYFLSKWDVDISISSKLPDYAVITIDSVSILVRESDVFIVDASFWLENPDHIGRFLPYLFFDSYFIFHTNSAEKKRVIEIVTSESDRFF